MKMMNSSEKSKFTALIESILSSEGGMHRAFHHRLAIYLPNITGHEHEYASGSGSGSGSGGKQRGNEDENGREHEHGRENSDSHNSNDSKTTNANAQLSLSGNVVLHLPILEGYFLDLDDPFRHDLNDVCQIQMQSLKSPKVLSSNSGGDNCYSNHNPNNSHITAIKCHVEVITIPNAVIDIEQPSFVSSQHVVAIRVNFDVIIQMQLYLLNRNNNSNHNGNVDNGSNSSSNNNGNEEDEERQSVVIDFVPI